MKQLGMLRGASRPAGVLNMEGNGEDGMKTIVDFAPDPTKPNLTTRTELSIQSAAETSRKGVVRLLVKVNIPYSGLYPSDVATGESNLKFSPNRSTGSVSAHLVLTLPKECVQDIVQQKAGSAGRECAFGHIQAVLGILQSLNPLGNGSTYALDTEEGKALSVKELGDIPVVVDLEPTTPKISASGAYNTLITLVDRACRGYTPLADVDLVGAKNVS